MSHESTQLERLRAVLGDRYRLKRELGRGGMATVYLAHDVKHERDVAVKVLRAELVAVLGPDRFLQEIKLTARLNHPHILSLLDSGDADGIIYYVMPYVEGESLRHRLNRETQLPIDEVRQLGQQIASALHYAHQQGVVHRDIKPENILLHAGEAMVADFGIALALSAAGGDRLTATGYSVGTPEYMSPEQASGAREVDARSDVYSLACVLYEMLVGDPPFTAQTAQAIIARQVLDPPASLRTVRPSVSHQLEAVVLRALAKTPVDRWETAAELTVGLQGGILGTPIPPTNGAPLGITRRSGIARLFLGATLALGVGWGVWYVTSPRSTVKPTPSFRQATFSGSVSFPQISPDGGYVAYVQHGDTNRLHIRDLQRDGDVAIADVEDLVMNSRWKPDGSSILVSSRSSNLFAPPQHTVFPRLPGTAQSLRPHVGLRLYHAWSPDGTQLAGSIPNFSPIQVITIASGDATYIELPDSGYVNPIDWSPDGRRLALTIEGQSGGTWAVWTVSLAGHEWILLARDTVRMSGPRWSPTGDAVYFLRGDDLAKQRVGTDGRPRGAAQLVQVGFDGFSSWVHDGLSISDDGRTLAFTRLRREPSLQLVSVNGAQSTMLALGTARKSPARLSPNGDLVAYFQFDTRGGDVYVTDTLGRMRRALTSDRTVSVTSLLGGAAPEWSPDGERIAFGAQSGEHVILHIVVVESGEVIQYPEVELGATRLTWAPDGRILYPTPKNQGLRLFDPRSASEITLEIRSSPGAFFAYPVISPDGARVAVARNLTNPDSGWGNAIPDSASGVVIISVPDASTKFLEGSSLAIPMGWSSDGASLYIQKGGSDRMLLLSVEDGTALAEFSVPVGSFNLIEGFPSPGQHAECMPVERDDRLDLLCQVEETTSDAWIIENFDPDVR